MSYQQVGDEGNALTALSRGNPMPVPSMQTILDGLHVGVLLFQRNPHDQIVCYMANRAYEEMFDLKRFSAIGLTPADLAQGCMSSQCLSALQHCFDTGNAGSLETSYREAPFERHFTCELAPLAWEQERPTHVMVSITDRTHEKAADRHRQHLISHDSLTGLPNRVLFSERVEQAVANAERAEGRAAAVLVLNVDRFKLINESMGHVSGDELLISLGRRLVSCLRSGDILARLSSDEFAILCEVGRIEDALALADSIHADLRAPFMVSGQELFTSLSVGVASTSTSGFYAEDLIRDADFAMHRAKNRGGAHTEVYHGDLHRQARSLFQLETDLRKAVDRGELELHYQPIVDLQSGALMGMEALARWHHKERGYVSPADFVPLAEETGLIIPIGRWSLDEACRQLGDWRRAFGDAAAHLQMSVNVSGVQFARDDLAAAVTGALQRSGVPGDRLKLEITESAIVENPDLAKDVLDQLKSLNVELALDDFGTGYSSLSYLQRFPIDVIKIDRSFIADMLAIQDNYKIVNVILSLARNLGKETVAEGIETEAQADTLRALGCQLGQGYLFSRALSGTDATAHIGAALKTMSRRLGGLTLPSRVSKVRGSLRG